MPIGSSLYDEEGAKIVPEILAKAEKLGASFGSIFLIEIDRFSSFFKIESIINIFLPSCSIFCSKSMIRYPGSTSPAEVLRSSCQWISPALPSSEKMARLKKAWAKRARGRVLIGFCNFEEQGIRGVR